ncbi:Na/Pi cotransporter family protein [Candidatus Peregrinibacteria bacterium]|nr:Na/Pi cotransporter family protein [Candidatus Peregrinibacteria bacterium]
MNWTILIGFLVGLVIFIHGIENFSSQIMKFAGEGFRKFLRYATRNRFISAISGMLVTSVIQSSSVTTVITISLVSAGAISFANSLGIIVGANVGTTITAQLVAFKITSFAPIFLITGFILSFFGRQLKYIGRGIFYFGLLFYGLFLISEAIGPLSQHPGIHKAFAELSNPYIALLVGFLFTAIAQSSSIATGIVVILAASGFMTLEQGLPVLLGTNIGTTIKTIYISLNLSRFAKRTALAHMIFNILGVVIIWPFLPEFSSFVSSLGGSSAQQLANAHTIFNVLAAIIFLGLLTPFKKLIEKIIKTDEEEILISAKYIENGLPKTKKKMFSIIEKELTHFLHIAYKLYIKSSEFIISPSDKSKNTIEKYEVLANLLDEKIEGAILQLSTMNLTESEAKKTVLLVRISNMVEQLADTCKSLSGLRRSMSISSLSLSDDALSSIKNIVEKTDKPFFELQKGFPYNIENTEKLNRRLAGVPPAITKSYNEHIKRLKGRKAKGGSIFVEATSQIENATIRIKEIISLAQKYARLK